MPPILCENSPGVGEPALNVSGYSAMPNTLQEMEGKIQSAFLGQINVEWMLNRSSMLQEQYKSKLRKSHDCMLPSYCHTLPDGEEKGKFLSLDIGGSTLRVAMVELNGRVRGSDAVCIKRMSSALIDDEVRKMSGLQFFDWIAANIETLLAKDSAATEEKRLPLGIAWSFPLEQTGRCTGRIRDMGKAFNHHEIIGQDLGELMIVACGQRKVRVRVDAIVNDSSAALLCQAYTNPYTSISLVVGTGTNAGVFLPVSCFGREKLGVRDVNWRSQARMVITNTELSMFGIGILPDTRWDELLNSSHTMPDFQPLEYKTSGMYLGEILRLIILDAINTSNLWGGIIPPALQRPYSLSTAMLALLEEDQSPLLQGSRLLLQRQLGLPTVPSTQEAVFLKSATQAISHRAAAYLAIALHALLVLQRDLDNAASSSMGSPKTTIACCGSVIQKYPGFRQRCQDYIVQMFSAGSLDGGFLQNILLQSTEDATILGAAVAVALAQSD